MIQTYDQIWCEDRHPPWHFASDGHCYLCISFVSLAKKCGSSKFHLTLLLFHHRWEDKNIFCIIMVIVRTIGGKIRIFDCCSPNEMSL